MTFLFTVLSVIGLGLTACNKSSEEEKSLNEHKDLKKTKVSEHEKILEDFQKIYEKNPSYIHFMTDAEVHALNQLYRSQVQELKETFDKIKALPKDVKVYPGHENNTTIEYELSFNRFLNY